MTSDPGKDGSNMGADPGDPALEALDGEIAELKAQLGKAFSAEKASAEDRSDDPRRIPRIDSAFRLYRDAEPSGSGEADLPASETGAGSAGLSKELPDWGSAEDLAFIFGNKSDIADASGVDGDDGAGGDLDKASREDTGSGKRGVDSGEIELIQDSSALKTDEKKPVSEMTPEELAVHIEKFRAEGKSAQSANYRALGAAISLLATLAAMVLGGYVLGNELAGRTGFSWILPVCLVAGAVLGFACGFILIRPLMSDKASDKDK